MPDVSLALLMVKTRLNRMASDTSLDEYLTIRIQGAMEQMNHMFRVKLDDSTEDLVNLVDFTVWQYQNRDQSGAPPEWLRKRMRERFLRRGGDGA